MKILFSHFGIFNKGGWGRTFSLASGLAEQGHKVTLLTTNPLKSILIRKKKIQGVEVVIFPDVLPIALTSKGFGGLSLLLKLIYVMFRSFDIVHSDSGHRPSAGWPCLWNRFMHNSKYIAEWWDFFGEGGQLENKPLFFKKFLGKFETWSELNDKRAADGIVVLSKYMEKRANKLGISSENIRIIHGGADIKNIPKLEWSKSKSKFGIENNILTLGYIGMSDGDVADLHPLLNVISKFKGKVKLVTFGKKISQPFYEKYRLDGIIHEMGWIDYLTDSEKMSVVDLFLLIKTPNDINIAGWPNKLGDYLASGRPVLITPYGDVKTFVENHMDAFIIVERSEKIIEEKITKIINGEFNLEKMGEYARNIAEEKISWLSKSIELSEFYNDTLFGL